MALCLEGVFFLQLEWASMPLFLQNQLGLFSTLSKINVSALNLGRNNNYYYCDRPYG